MIVKILHYYNCRSHHHTLSWGQEDYSVFTIIRTISKQQSGGACNWSKMQTFQTSEPDSNNYFDLIQQPGISSLSGVRYSALI